MRETGEPVTIIHQSYFIDPTSPNKYSCDGTNWELFYKQVLSLLIGNTVEINYKKNGEDFKMKVKTAKLLIL